MAIPCSPVFSDMCLRLVLEIKHVISSQQRSLITADTHVHGFWVALASTAVILGVAATGN